MADLNYDNVFMLPVLSCFCKISNLWVNPASLEIWKIMRAKEPVHASPQLCPWIWFEQASTRASEVDSYGLFFFLFSRKQMIDISQWAKANNRDFSYTCKCIFDIY